MESEYNLKDIFLTAFQEQRQIPTWGEPNSFCLQGGEPMTRKSKRLLVKTAKNI